MIYIWIRSTADWADEEAFWAQVPPRVKPAVELWNATISMPFHLFRHRVREIAALNQSRVEGAPVAEWDEIPEGALVLPVDDDDWFSPDAAGVLGSERDPGARAYLWDSRWIEVPISAGHRLYLVRRRLLPWTPPKWICTSNNYAIRKSPGAKEILGDHMRASEWFKSRLGSGAGAGVKRIARELSITNRTLASMTSLRVHHPHHSLGRSELVRKFHGYNRLYRAPGGSAPGWARPYVEMMAVLMDELEIKAGA